MRKTLIIAVTGILFLFVASCPAAHGQQTLDSNALKLLRGMNMDSLINGVISRQPPEKQKNMKEALAAIKKDKPELKLLHLKNKTVAFIPMVHAGQQQFYDNVKSMIATHKKNGYTVFYEEIKKDGAAAGATATNQDAIRRKLRKIVGVEPTRQLYSMLKILYPTIAVQPTYDKLGITGTDVNADISASQLVGQYEKLYGKVDLDSCDYKTPFGGLYNCGERKLPDATPVILDYRNQNLAAMIKKAPQRKILVVYGANHIDATMKLISK